jgi:ADP-heptose:LPS heptosyltransferase
MGFNAVEKRWAEGVAEDKPYILNFAGRCDIIEEVGLLGGMDLVISTDTGLMHLADAAPNPHVIALFGGTMVSKNGPWNTEKAQVLRAPVQCVGCQSTPPIWLECARSLEEGPWPCMKSITPQMVMGLVRDWDRRELA